MPGTSGGLTPIQENQFYIGCAKQAAWGTAVAPTQFYRWLDGTDANPETKFQSEREGDTSPYMSLIYKASQYWAFKVMYYARPIGLGQGLQALLGSGSDSYTAPTKSGTLSSAVAAGATTFSTALNLGNTGTLALNFTPGYSASAYEVATVNLVSQSGTGPYTYTLANSAAFKNAHASGDAITSASTHTLTRQNGPYDAFSFDSGFLPLGSGPGKSFRTQDAVCYQIDLASQTGKPLAVTEYWYGCLSAIDAAQLSPVYEGQSVVSAAGGPLLHRQAQSNWLVDGASSGNAATVRGFRLTAKNGTAVEDFLTEGLSPAFFIPGTIDITGALDVVFQSYSQYLETYFGSASAASGTTDSYITGFGSTATTYTADAVNSLNLSLPNVYYTAPKLTPKLDGKPLPQQLAFAASRPNSAVTPFTATLSNSWASQY